MWNNKKTETRIRAKQIKGDKKNEHRQRKEMIKEDLHVKKTYAGQRGTMLVGLIITLIIVSVLGAAMLSFFSTSTMSQLSGNSSMRAYYLAESGFRYADGELAHTSMSVRDSKIEGMHDTDYVLADNDGKFHLEMYPYFFKVDNDPGGTTVLDTRVPGGFPSGQTLTSGYVYIEDSPYQYSNATQSGNTVTFTRASGNWPSIDSGTTVHSASMPDGNQTVTSVNNYIDLESSTGSANAFPELNGIFRVGGKSGVWVYKVRSGNRLEGVSPLDDPEWSKTAALGISATDYIILDKYVEVQSTGIMHESEELETSRELTYYTSLSESYKTTFHETFEDKSHWSESSLGAHEIKTIGGDSALKVTGTTSVTGAPKASLIGLSSTAINLGTVRDFAYGYLSYDAQVKVGFEEDPYPIGDYYPAKPIPSYYVAGISFRLDNNNKCYGLSFMRGDNRLGPPYDNIPNEIVPDPEPYPGPLNVKSYIVLWQQTNLGTQRALLAYKELPTNFPVNLGTLMVRITEAATIPFTIVDGTTAIEKGDVVVKVDTEAEIGTVIESPILETESWTSGTSGIIALNGNISTGDVVDGDRLYVAGKGSTGLVTVRGTELLSPRANLIRAYYTEIDDNGTPSAYYLDDERYGNGRGEVHWPPDDVSEWSKENDYFTLVQWDYHTGAQSISSFREPNAIIWTDTLTSLTAVPEMGLHTFGHGSTNVFFDDFAIQAEIRAKRTGFMSTIQQ